MKMIKGNFLH